MIIRCHVCSADPARAGSRRRQGSSSILTKSTGAFETSPCTPAAITCRRNGRQRFKSGKKTTGGRRANCDERPKSTAHATEDAAALDDCQEAADYAPLRRLCSAAKQTLLDTLPNLDDHRFEDGCRTMDVGSWLRSLGLGQYEANFRDNKIDADVLPRADGRRPQGHRRLCSRRSASGCSMRSPRWLAQRRLPTRCFPAEARAAEGLQTVRRAPPDHGDVLRSCRLDEPCRET